MRAFLLLSVLFSNFSLAQQCTVDSLFNLFKKDIQIELRRHKQIQWDDETKESYYTLIGTCNTKLLVKYLDDSIPAVRCLIFAGLARKGMDSTFLHSVVLKHRNDTSLYTESPTDVVITYTVADFMQSAFSWAFNKRSKDTIDSYESQVDKLRSRFRIIIPVEHHGIITKSSLLAVKSLTCSFKDHKVISFSLNDQQTKVQVHNIFNREIKDYIRRIKPNCIIYIDNIVIEAPDKSRRTVSPLILEVSK